VLTARTHVAEALARTTALQKGYLRLRNDFQQLRIRPVRDGYGAEQPALLVRPDDAVEFTRGGWRNPLSQRARASSAWPTCLDDKRRLVRQSWRVLDRAQASEPVELPVFEQVEEVKWRFSTATSPGKPAGHRPACRRRTPGARRRGRSSSRCS